MAREAARSAITIMLVNMTSCNDTVCLEEIDSVVDDISALAGAFQELPSERNPIWEYGSAMYFASTVITTIGEWQTAVLEPLLKDTLK